MAYDKQLFIGKLSSVTPNYDNVVAFTGDVSTGIATITNIANFNATFDISLLRVGQIINTFGLGFATNVIITNISGTTLTVDTPANASGTNQTFAADTPAGTYFISSASFLDPQNIVDVNDITGSLDEDYNEELSPKYAISAPTSPTLAGSTILGKFHNYVITSVPFRDITTAKISAFVSWGEDGIESDSGEVMYQGGNQSVAIGAMSVTSSQLSTFDPQIVSGLDSGASVGPYQITLPSVIDKTGSEDPFPYTGSAEITGSLEVTGSVDFLINSGETFKVSNTLSPTQSLFTINQEGVAIFRAREGSDGTPTVTPGAMYFTTESVFFGFDDGV
jgi:hypothetical protein